MLGLLVETSSDWVTQAAREVHRVLVDHAHCEMKAATNALSLTARCGAHPHVAEALIDLAEEELRHFRRVLEELFRRGIHFGAPEEDWYAAQLRRRSAPKRGERRSEGVGDAVLVDRLLVAALIEARSCERFKLLASALRDAKENELASFYDELFASEARHHAVLVGLAVDVGGDEASVRARLTELATIEASVVRDLKGAPTIHG